MLEAVPRCLFPLTFDVMLNLEKVGEIDLGWSWIRQKSEFRIGDSICQVRLASAFQPGFTLICDGRIVAIAKPGNAFVREFDVDADGHPLQLRAVAFWKSEIAVFKSGVQIGRILPEKFMSHRAIIDLPDDIPLELQFFLFWLFRLLWQRGWLWAACLEALACF